MRDFIFEINYSALQIFLLWIIQIFRCEKNIFIKTRSWTAIAIFSLFTSINVVAVCLIGFLEEHLVNFLKDAMWASWTVKELTVINLCLFVFHLYLLNHALNSPPDWRKSSSIPYIPSQHLITCFSAGDSRCRLSITTFFCQGDAHLYEGCLWIPLLF